MIADLKPYPAMKDSSVPWLGEVPEHWAVFPLKRLVSPRITDGPHETPPLLDAGVDFMSAESMVNGRLDFSRRRGFISRELHEFYCRKCRPQRHDVFMCKSGATTGKVAIVETDDEFSVWSPLALIRADMRKVLPRLLYIVLGAGYVQRQVQDTWSYGTQPNLSMAAMERLLVVTPHLLEQAAIVRFLDHADRRIRRYILAKQKLIKLLEEQKQTIIHRAVTRGLDPNVRLKPSGVEWLGDVPEHWEVSQIRSIAHVVRGSSPRPAGSPAYFHGADSPWITVGEVTKASGMYVRTTSTRLTPAGAERSRMIEAGTLLLTNSGATLGIPKISLIQGCINDGVAAFLNLSPRVNKEFLCLYWSTQTTHLKAWVDLGAQPNLNTQIIGGWPVPLPASDEQEEIVYHVIRETALIADAIDRARREISLLREYRTRLIADVVTGKLDVRESAASLPDEVDERETLDDIAALTEGDEDTVDRDLDAVPEEVEA